MLVQCLSVGAVPRKRLAQCFENSLRADSLSKHDNTRLQHAKGVRFLCIYVLAGGIVISPGRSRTAWAQQARLFVHFVADVTAITFGEIGGKGDFLFLRTEETW